MSHFKQRKEKDCLNCHAEVVGRYCHICGQENTEPKLSFGQLISHFFNDITHFDGKFFSTLGTLMRRPGHLTAEYVKGRRMSYLDPIRMYIFTSAIFFLLFFSIFHSQQVVKMDLDRPATRVSAVEMMKDQELHKYTLRRYKDSLMTRQEAVAKAVEEAKNDSLQQVIFFKDLSAYDSIQSKLPEKQRDGWMKRSLKNKAVHLNELFKKDPKKFLEEANNKFLHKLPQLMFISLPLFALCLKLLYRRRKDYYYTDHGIFAIHLYIFSFINLVVWLCFAKLQDVTGWKIFGFAQFLIIVWILIYQYKALRNFYQQGRLKTILKFLLLNFLSSIVMILLLLIFILFTAATI